MREKPKRGARRGSRPAFFFLRAKGFQTGRPDVYTRADLGVLVRRGTLAVATVLIVDDNADICRVLARLVRAAGHHAEVAPGGQEAIDYLADRAPDMIILDIMMPRVDGIAVLRAIRGNPATADLPVIMFTAAGDGELREHALRQGATAYWVKGSLDLSQLDRHLSNYLAPAAG